MTYILLVKTYRISWRKKQAISLLKSIINRSELMDIHAILDRTITHTHTHTHIHTHTISQGFPGGTSGKESA